ncbi:hypothetical protein TNCV_1749601 [Trichonephila clavipes]|nr:hypothetical protein TNCV_1749601 [Trichonephila clavipes]
MRENVERIRTGPTCRRAKENNPHKWLSKQTEKDRRAITMKRLLWVWTLLLVESWGAEDVYDIGVGIADITGPAADINMNKSSLKFRKKSDPIEIPLVCGSICAEIALALIAVQGVVLDICLFKDVVKVTVCGEFQMISSF